MTSGTSCRRQVYQDDERPDIYVVDDEEYTGRLDMYQGVWGVEPPKDIENKEK